MGRDDHRHRIGWVQEEMQESEEHFSRLLQDEHARLEACEREFKAAVREAGAHLAEAALAEEHLLYELRLTQRVRLLFSPCMVNNLGFLVVSI